MKQRLTPVALGLCLLGMVTVPVFAADVTQTTDNGKILAKLEKLENEVSSLKKQLRTQRKANWSSKAHAGTNANSIPSSDSNVVTAAEHQAQADRGGKNQPQIAGPNNLPSSGLQYLPVDVDVPGQSFISNGPYIGIPLEYSGTNLIINSPSVNQDVALLKIRKNIHARLKELGVQEEEGHTHVLMSGVVEGAASYKDIGGGPNTSDIDLTSAGLDAYILGPSSWTSALISMNYVNDPGSLEGSLASNSRSVNSRVFINQAFITIGDLATTGLYGTVGQLYVPFGTYSSNMVSSPLTKILARTKARAIVLGYQQQAVDAFYASTYIFRGDSHAATTSRINNGGINVGYRFAVQDKMTGDFGAGVIANMADSVGMQFTEMSPFFNGFGGTGGTGNEMIVHRVPAYDLRGMVSLGGHVDLLAEYITASTRFNPNDLTMNGHGAKPRALNAEAAYSFSAFSKPTSVALGYGMSKDALAIGLPAQRYSFVINTSFWRNTLESLEFRHDINYAASNTASGSLVPAPSASGKSDNAITAQFDLYF